MSATPTCQPTGGQFAAQFNPEHNVDLAEVATTIQRCYLDGSVKWEFYRRNGKLQDPADGRPAERWCRPDGSVQIALHYQNGVLQDPADGSPAARWTRSDGSVVSETHFQNGKRQEVA